MRALSLPRAYLSLKSRLKGRVDMIIFIASPSLSLMLNSRSNVSTYLASFELGPSFNMPLFSGENTSGYQQQLSPFSISSIFLPFVFFVNKSFDRNNF